MGQLVIRVRAGTRLAGFMLLAATIASVAACSSSDQRQTPTPSPPATNTPVAPTETPTPSPPATNTPVAPTETSSGQEEQTPTANVGSPVPRQFIEITDEDRLRQFVDVEGWNTDFELRSVELGEFISILVRDGIDPVDDPTFAPVSDPPSYMKPREPVIAVEINGDARAYPLAMLMWHEIANDVVGGEPVAVTFCPLCNTAIAFKRTVDGKELTFGTTGKVRDSDLVMWDRQTESWWQQITGEAIVGQYAGLGAELEVISSPIVAWESFAGQYPHGSVMERIFDDRGFPVKRYDLPPYAGYDSVDASPFLFDDEIDGRMPANVRVLTAEIDGSAVAYPFAFLRQFPVVNDTAGDEEIVIFFDSGTLSAFVDPFDNRLTSGSTTMFSRRMGERTLTFELEDNGIRDVQTGSTWNLFGEAISGPLTGSTLDPVIHANHFWFAWAVFQPDTEIKNDVELVAGPVSVQPHPD